MSKDLASLPQGWEILSLEEIASQKPQNGAFVKNPIWGQGTLYVNVKDLYRGVILDCKFVERLECDSSYLKLYGLQENDLLFVRSSLKREGIGQCALISKLEEPAIFDCHLIRVIPDISKTFPLYLSYFFGSEIGRKNLIAISNTTTMTTINQQSLMDSLVVLPRLEEQRAIATTLSTIQTAKESRQKELVLERERKAALMDYLFTHGTCNEPCKQTELGEIPESWEVIRLGEIVKLKSGTSRPDNLLSNPTENTNVPVFGGNGILGYTSQIFSSDRQLVIGRVGAYCGCVHIAEAPNWITDNALYSERFMGDISLDFIAEYLRFSNLNSLQMKGGQPLITQSILHKFYIILPSLIEQQEIANVLSSCDAKIATLEREIKLHDELFRAMLEELMTGQLSSLPLA